MSKIDDQKVISHLQNKWGSRPCPMCEKGPWSVQDTIYQITEYHEGGLVVGGPVIPVIPVICTNCGYAIFVNAIVANLMERLAPPEKEAPK